MMARTTAGTVRVGRGALSGCLLLQTPERSAAIRLDDYHDMIAGLMHRPIDVVAALYDRIGRATVSGDALHVELAGCHYHAWCSDLAALLEGRRGSVALGLLTPEYSTSAPATGNAGRPLHA